MSLLSRTPAGELRKTPCLSSSPPDRSNPARRRLHAFTVPAPALPILEVLRGTNSPCRPCPVETNLGTNSPCPVETNLIGDGSVRRHGETGVPRISWTAAGICGREEECRCSRSSVGASPCDIRIHQGQSG